MKRAGAQSLESGRRGWRCVAGAEEGSESRAAERAGTAPAGAGTMAPAGWVEAAREVAQAGCGARPSGAPGAGDPGLGARAVARRGR